MKTLQSQIEVLLKTLKKDIRSDDRAHGDDTLPGLLVTIGAEKRDDGHFSWSYQTGDNSYTGGAYGFPNWAVISLYRRSNCRDLAQAAVSEILELMH